MSFDLGVWSAGVRPSRAEAVNTYVRLCEGDAQAVRPAPEVAAFHAALVAEFPEPVAGSDAAVDESAPWSAGLDVGPGHVVMPMAWGRAADVAPRVLELAARHELVCFDPQAGVVHLPPALRSPGAPELRSCVGLPVADPDPETVRRAIAGLSSDNWFVLLEEAPGRFLQVGIGESAGAGAGGYAVEFRDGSPEEHYRVVVSDRDQVTSLFAAFHRDPSVRPAAASWRSIWE